MFDLKVFIAGSKALEEQRKLFRAILSRMQNLWKISIEGKTFEDFSATLVAGGRQKEYNDYIANEADVVVFVFDGKVGGITLEEFDVAYNALLGKKRPEILVFYRKVGEVIHPDIIQLKEKLEQSNQYYIEYSDNQELETLFKECINSYLIGHIQKRAIKKQRKKLMSCTVTITLLLLCVLLPWGIYQYTERSGVKLSSEKVAVLDDTEQERIESSVSNYHNGHEYVDLGLSVKWATCNVGASTPEEYGKYYAWGEIATKADYASETSKTWGKSLGDIGGNPSHDAARAEWGGSWRLPTKAEIAELLGNCEWKWTTQGGKKGYQVTSKINGKSIFLPAAGFRNGSSLDGDGSDGYYWSSAPDESNTYRAYYLYFNSGHHNVFWNSRYYGFSVRPVVE